MKVFDDLINGLLCDIVSSALCIWKITIWICADLMFDELKNFEREIEESLKKSE